MLRSVNSGKMRISRNMILMLQSARVIRSRILKLRRVNGGMTGVSRNAILNLRNVEVAG